MREPGKLHVKKKKRRDLSQLTPLAIASRIAPKRVFSTIPLKVTTSVVFSTHASEMRSVVQLSERRPLKLIR